MKGDDVVLGVSRCLNGGVHCECRERLIAERDEARVEIERLHVELRRLTAAVVDGGIERLAQRDMVALRTERERLLAQVAALEGIIDGLRLTIRERQAVREGRDGEPV